MITVELYDTEHCYGFDFAFEDEMHLNSFLKLNTRYKRYDSKLGTTIENTNPKGIIGLLKGDLKW